MSPETTPEAGLAYATATDAAAPPLLADPLREVAVRRRRRPFVLQARGRATVVVLVVGLPLVTAFVVAQLLPGALWFDELGQGDVFRRTIEAKAELFGLAGGAAALLVGTSLALPLSRINGARSCP